MTIEDVEFLIENSDLNSLTIVIDSRERDYSAYPTPSSYVIPFEEPLKNVVGLEILDASIPVTEFSIDKHNHVLCVGYMFHTIGVSSAQICDQITNYLQYSATFGKLYENKSSANFFTYTQENEFNAINSSLDSSHNMMIYFKTIPITRTLGRYQFKGFYSDDNDLDKLVSSHNEYYISTETLELILYKFKYVTDNDALLMAGEIRSQNEDPTIDIGFDALICNVYYEIPIQNFTSTKLFAHLNGMVLYNDIFIAITGGDSIKVVWEDPVYDGETSTTQRFIWKFQSTKSYAFYLDMDKSTCAGNIGFSEMNINRNTSILRYKNYGRLHYSSLFQDISQVTNQFVNTQKIISPGLVILEGVRYVELHCPEIEAHILGNYTNFKYSPGIGLFKMVNTNTISHLRFDFLNIIRKPFHPIGKLSRLTIQFTNRNGQLYDFKSVDHTILIAIKYYEPKPMKRSNVVSPLNTLYNPNIVDYKMKTNTIRKPGRYLEDVLNEQKRFS